MKALRIRKPLRYVTVLVASFLFFACSGEKKAADMFEIAAFEEVQFNTEHAMEIYRKIIEKYPETEAARKAQLALERLSKKPVDN